MHIKLLKLRNRKETDLSDFLQKDKTNFIYCNVEKFSLEARKKQNMNSKDYIEYCVIRITLNF